MQELAWNCLSVAQRLSIIDAVDESCNSLESTFKLLRLTPQQRDFTIALLEERNEYIDAEVGLAHLAITNRRTTAPGSTATRS